MFVILGLNNSGSNINKHSSGRTSQCDLPPFILTLMDAGVMGRNAGSRSAFGPADTKTVSAINLVLDRRFALQIISGRRFLG
jgi:hypothetical protein